MEDARRMVGWIPYAADDARCLEFALGWGDLESGA